IEELVLEVVLRINITPGLLYEINRLLQVARLYGNARTEIQGRKIHQNNRSYRFAKGRCMKVLYHAHDRGSYVIQTYRYSLAKDFFRSCKAEPPNCRLVHHEYIAILFGKRCIRRTLFLAFVKPPPGDQVELVGIEIMVVHRLDADPPRG